MSTTTPRFNSKDRPEFFKELRRRVNAYFEEKQISRHANFNMRFKTGFMLSLYLVPLAMILTGLADSTGELFLMWGLMGFGMCGVGLAITHDANHRAYSDKEGTNKAFGALLNLIGGYHVNWRIQHNVIHHSFTNVEDHDEDIQNPLLRFSPGQARKPLHRFQAYYAPFLYCLMSLFWLVYRDFALLRRYNREKFLKRQGLSLAQGYFRVSLNKAVYAALFIGLPVALSPLPWWQVLLGFLTMHMIAGLLLAFIFQTAHVVEDTEVVEVAPDSSIQDHWAIHQLKTTANYAMKSVFFSWFIGGLNYQIEHHLFPNICHIHYRKISRIVKATAEEFGIPYLQNKTFFSAVRSHLMTLDRLGRAG